MLIVGTLGMPSHADLHAFNRMAMTAGFLGDDRSAGCRPLLRDVYKIAQRLRVSRHAPYRVGAPLVQEHRCIQGVALGGLEAGVTDDAAQLFFRGAVRGASCLDDVLLEHDRADIITTKAQAHL